MFLKDIITKDRKFWNSKFRDLREKFIGVTTMGKGGFLPHFINILLDMDNVEADLVKLLKNLESMKLTKDKNKKEWLEQFRRQLANNIGDTEPNHIMKINGKTTALQSDHIKNPKKMNDFDWRELEKHWDGFIQGKIDNLIKIKTGIGEIENPDALEDQAIEENGVFNFPEGLKGVLKRLLPEGSKLENLDRDDIEDIAEELDEIENELDELEDDMKFDWQEYLKQTSKTLVPLERVLTAIIESLFDQELDVKETLLSRDKLEISDLFYSINEIIQTFFKNAQMQILLGQMAKGEDNTDRIKELAELLKTEIPKIDDAFAKEITRLLEEVVKAPHNYKNAIGALKEGGLLIER